jgi:hypothetical protein
MAVNFCTLVAKTHFISTIRNAGVSDLVCLCVTKDRSCTKQWMVEGAIAMKKVCEMDSKR